MTEQSWCLSGELPLAVAEKLETIIGDLADAQGDYPPTLSYFEQDNGNNPLWRVEVFFPSAPDYGLISQMLQQADLLDWEHDIAPLENKDWVSESQKLLQPVEAGCFFVYGSHDAAKAKANTINLQVDAGQAFGTGKHETTAACLETMSACKESLTPATVLDLGTGSGVLALAAHKLWPTARVTASDIDPIAIDVTRENIEINNGVLRQRTDPSAGIKLAVADGLHDEAFSEDRPFNFIVANILAGPLIDMAADITDALASGGTLVLSGLLCTQKKEVLDAYEARGLSIQGRIEKGEWLALKLFKE